MAKQGRRHVVNESEDSLEALESNGESELHEGTTLQSNDSDDVNYNI